MRNETPGRIGSVPVQTAAAMRPHTPTATTISGDSVSGITGSTLHEKHRIVPPRQADACP
jgi:hypothetical protein